MKNNHPILLFRNLSNEPSEILAPAYSLKTGVHTVNLESDTDRKFLTFTNSMQTKTREAIDTIENSEL